MNKQTKKEIHSKILAGLTSKDSRVIKDSINQLREEGQLGDINILFDMLLEKPESEVKEAIVKFLADIKERGAKAIFVQALNNKKYVGIRKELVGICWQSSIDFTEHIGVFTDILINSKFETAFEAFTVIENFTGNLEESTKLKEKDKLKNAISTVPEETKSMIYECIHILDQF